MTDVRSQEKEATLVKTEKKEEEVAIKTEKEDAIEEKRTEEPVKKEEEERKEIDVCALKQCGKPLDRSHRATVHVKCANLSALSKNSTVVNWQSDGSAFLHRECWEVATASLPKSNNEHFALYSGPRLRLRVSPEERAAFAAADTSAEYFDSTVVEADKARSAASLILKAKYCVVFSGAGISTSAGICDFRGPDGRWTRLMEEQAFAKNHSEDEEKETVGDPPKEKKQRRKSSPQVGFKRPRKLPEMRQLTIKEMNESTEKFLNSAETGPDSTPTTFTGCDAITFAQPTVAHEVIAELVAKDLIKVIITQNVDGLHQASGVPREKVVELHGNAFTEFCVNCGTSYERNYVVNQNNRSCGGKLAKNPGPLCEQCGLSHWTPRKCGKCHHRLRDCIVNFGDALSEPAFTAATNAMKKADVVICLGSSLIVSPAKDLLTVQGSTTPALVICNRQRTAFDRRSTEKGVRVFGDCDDFMSLVKKNVLSSLESSISSSSQSSSPSTLSPPSSSL